MKDTILVLTNAGEVNANIVIKLLSQMGQRVFRFNTEQFPSTAILTFGLRNGSAHGKIACEEERIDLERVKSVWYRSPYPSTNLTNFSGGNRRFIEEESKAALWSLYTNIRAFWVNAPLVASRLLEGNKLYQIKTALSVGLAVPKTIISNDVEEIMKFCEACENRLAVKMLSGRVFYDSQNKSMSCIYTQLITDEDIVRGRESIRWAPLFAQEYVPKAFELRVTIVGTRIFACAIHSQTSERTRHDWRRYDFSNVEHKQYNLPNDVATKLLRFMEMLELQYGAIDMIVTPEGKHVFLEINPGGQWGWIEDLTNMPISQSIAQLLAKPPTKI